MVSHSFPLNDGSHEPFFMANLAGDHVACGAPILLCRVSRGGGEPSAAPGS